ncbi:hypothetical protein [Paracoccus sp. (in: a-proteobacteria)]|uniref:hypothetical protein n=1 Tax=Paracoccus sp. TaxID=267 RepID=UPI002B00089D|nr:hypothetical protein [Paracoccus sp. (in: a-proteobacteria)]
MQARPVVELAGILRREGRGSMITSDTNVFVPFLTQADLTGPRQASALFSGLIAANAGYGGGTRRDSGRPRRGPRMRWVL